MLRWRDDERLAIVRVLVSARAGRGGGLILCGEPGIGKSALLDDACESATDMRVMRVTGVEAEASLGFAALHQLLRPIQDCVSELPAPQRQALSTALGVESGSPPDRFLISLATLTLLSEVAGERPLLCVVDDADWVDGPSLAVLGFVARRVETEPIALLASLRNRERGLFHASGMPILEIGGLRPEEARDLLEDEWGDGLAPAVRDAIV
jgi:hypothetical protein